MFITILILLLISLGINALFFLIAYRVSKDYFTDITYALTFIISTLLIMVYRNAWGLAPLIYFIVVSLWAIRLGSFLLFRVSKNGGIDSRFNNMRKSFWKFGTFWLFQALTVFIVNLGVVIITNKSGDDNTIATPGVILVVFAIAFLVYETIADLQKYKWKSLGKKGYINSGLWSSSRHPNYFGEYMFWIFLNSYVISHNFEVKNLLALISPIYIMLSLYFISGVPILEKALLIRYKGDSSYIEHILKTPCVIPFVGKKGSKYL